MPTSRPDDDLPPIIYHYQAAEPTQCSHPDECAILTGDNVWAYGKTESPWERTTLCGKHYGEKFDN
jgi:hypothetical protein